MNVIQKLMKMRTDINDLKAKLDDVITEEKRRINKRWVNEKEKNERAKKKDRQTAK